MTTVAPHRHSEAHAHTHGPNCGHQAVIHLDHVDYLHLRRLRLPHLQPRRVRVRSLQRLLR